ncbi:MAG TPA: hypothetical protein VK961_28565 [Chthoniobacter sp.]|nr:hypothetical protein [Chthoniobacter sp.]
MKWIVPLFAFACLALNAFGVLGETEDELAKRYGKQTKTGNSSLPGVTIRGYSYGSYTVIVGMLNGHAAYEMYAKKDSTKISPNDVAALMNANASGHMWAADTSVTGGAGKWVLDDGSAFAEFDKSSSTQLTVMTKEASDLSVRKPAGKK